ncbi:MAG: protein translocase subunit SecF [Alphaproteobacteria bacterium]|nr:protein translocase subunit SecF [Alphaproteobacteria bacterium]
MFKGVDFWPHKTIFEIMKVRKGFVLASIVAVALAIGLLATKGLNFGIDFKGGSLFEVHSASGPVDIAGLRKSIGALGLGDVQIQSFGSEDEALIRVEQQPGGEEAQQAASEKVKQALGDNVEIRRVEVVGGAVSSELKQAGIYACLSAILGILIYIWFRFEWQFGVAAILALVHDLLITLGVFSFLGLEFGLTEVAALLTLAGYSINDTVVVFDRIRENLRRYKKMALDELMNLSINQTLSRTILTGVTTALAILALFVFGTEVIRGFSFAMLFGVAIGTWSSIFVASPFLMWIGIDRNWTTADAKSISARA